jgi:hypothetical protein
MRIYGIYCYQSTTNRSLVMINNWFQNIENDPDYAKILLSTRVFWNIQSSSIGQTSYFKRIFGVPLDMIDEVENQVPRFVVSAVTKLLSAAQREEFNPFSVFPREPEEVACLGISKSIIENEIHSVQDIPDIRIVAALLMKFFKELPQPLVPNKIFNDMLSAQEIEEPWKIGAMHSILLQLDQSACALLRYMCEIIEQLTSATLQNKKNSMSHICACFGHLLLNPPVPKEAKRSSERLSNRKKLDSRSKTPREVVPPVIDGEILSNRSQCATILKFLIIHRTSLFLRESAEANYKFMLNSCPVLSSATLPRIIKN